jgi:hypothetical protein
MTAAAEPAVGRKDCSSRIQLAEEKAKPVVGAVAAAEAELAAASIPPADAVAPASSSAASSSLPAAAAAAPEPSSAHGMAVRQF